MQATHLLLLFLAILLVNVNAAAAAAEEIPQTNSPRPLLDKNDGKRGGLSSLNDDMMSGLVENEDRGFMSSVTEPIASKIKGLWKSTGLSSKFGRSGKNADLVAEVGRMPFAKKLDTLVENNPNFIEKLSKNLESIERLAKTPEVAKVSGMLKKNHVKVTQDDINRARVAVAGDPVKLSKLDVIEAIREIGRFLVLDTIAYILFASIVLGVIVLTT